MTTFFQRTDKQILIILFFITSCINILRAQPYTGFSNSTLSGVHGILLNPASIANSPFHWDVNLFSLHADVQNNNGTFKLSDFNTDFDSDKFFDQFVGANAKSTNALINIDFQGPSAMFKIGKAGAIGIGTRVRSVELLKNIDGALINEFSDGAVTYPTTIKINGEQTVTLNGWGEIGLSYARNLYANEDLSLFGGATLKLLGGGFNGYFTANNLQGTINETPNSNDTYLSNATGTIGMGFGGINLDDVNPTDLFTFDNVSAGFDLGVQLELKGKDPKYRNGYQFKFGLSLIDIGSVKYSFDQARSGTYQVNIASNQKFNFNEFDNVDIDKAKSVLQKFQQFFTPLNVGNNSGEYKVNLPTRLMAEVDYNLSKGWYVNFLGQLSLVKTTGSKTFNPAYFSGFTVTGRYETRHFGFWLPVNYNEASKFNAGLGISAGPLFIGSGSILGALFGGSKQADAFMGIRFGGRGISKAKAKSNEIKP